ncbi:DUF4432 family protein [Paenibacillus humicola]|uniref:DUF4432 family protein n=1 Tax=Paenibacillus humicola TaxID=3110540 RepID=UPI00237ADA47|nr:DUF4432 family protein [Paenibacillus humicola]
MKHSPCTIRETTAAGLDRLVLENGLLQISILAGKGADIYELIYKPLQMDVLLKTGPGLDGFRGRDLAERRLRMYSEIYVGGWQDCLPHRARYGGIEITQDNGGIAATLPWAYEVTSNTEDTVSVRCFVQLPEVPLDVEKTFTLQKGESTLHITQRIRNRGDAAASFTWTQHPAFGGTFLDETVDVEVPEGCIAFHPRQYAAAQGSDPAAFEEPIDRITLHGGAPRDIRKVLPRTASDQLFLVLKNAGEPWARLVNRRKGLGVQLRWQLDAFPYIRYWSSIGPGIYTVAVEPSNDAFASLDDSLAHGTYLELQPGGQFETRYSCELFETNRDPA